VQEQVAILRALMTVDERLRALHHRRAAQATERERQRTDVNLVAHELAQEEARLQAAEKRHRDAEREVETCRSQKAEFQKKLSAVKTNVEFHALLKEISAAEERAREWEDVILEAMELEEATRATASRVKAELDAKEAAAARAGEELDAAAEAARSEQAQLETQRTELLAQLNAATRARYERLLAAKGDSAIVAVLDASCGGCHYQLPPQMVNEVRSGRRLMTCEGCGRILVWPDEG